MERSRSYARFYTFVSLLLILCMVLPLAACRKKNGAPTEETPKSDPVPEDIASLEEATEPAYLLDGWKSIADLTDADGDFVPVLRFVAASDIHTRAMGVGTTDIPTADEVEASNSRTAALFSQSYLYAQKSAYSNLDAVIVAGDFTDFGRSEQYEAFLSAVNAEKRDGTELLVCLGNHEFWDAGEQASNSTETTATYARFAEYFGHQPDSHVVVGGFHFIGVSPDCNGGRNYSAEKGEWLAAQLQQAAAEDPTGQKPIFVYEHISPAYSVYGSAQTYDAGAAYAAITTGNAMKNYPQVVLLAGHSHRPVDDPASISQTDYTVLNTGTLAYGMREIFTDKGTQSVLPLGHEGGWYFDMDDRWYEHGERESCVFTLIEVDADNRVRVQYIDADGGRIAEKPIIIDSIGHRDRFTFTAARKSRAEIPYFETGAKIKIASLHASAVRLAFPHAVSRDGVRNYKAELYLNGERIDTVYRLPNTYFPPVPATLIAPFSRLQPATTYQVKIYAYNSWGQISTVPLTASFTTAAAGTVSAMTPDIFKLAMREDGTAYDAVSGKDLIKTGRVSTGFDEAVGRDVFKFTGDGAYQWRGMDSYTEVMKYGFTFEAYLEVNALPGNYDNPVSAQETGGFGFETKANGNMHYYVFSKEKRHYVTPGGHIDLNRYVHLVGVFDGTTVILYINGERVDAQPLGGNEIFFPVKPTARFLAIGADAGMAYSCGSHFTGRIAAVNIYSTPLDATQVAMLYTNR